MGREVKRVPEGFRWPVGKVWFGSILDAVPCELCGGDGKARTDGGESMYYYGPKDEHGFASEYCSVCGGEGTCCPKVEVPRGDWYQVWETVSEGSPVTPAFATPRELAEWMAAHRDDLVWPTATPDELEAWIKESGRAPSLVVTNAPEGCKVQGARWVRICSQNGRCPMFRSSVNNAPPGCRNGDYRKAVVEFRCQCGNEWTAAAFWEWGALHLVVEDTRFCTVCQTEGEQQ